MKRILIIISLFIGIIGYTQSEIPNTPLKTIKGKRVNPGKYNKSDKIVIVSFWATWCVNCINELDGINKKYKSWKKDIGVELVAVSVDDSRTKSGVKPLVSSKKWDYTILIDQNQKFKRKMNVYDIPYTAVYYKGKKVYTHSGYSQGFEKELEEVLKRIKKK